MASSNSDERVPPLSPKVFAILLALADGPAHGYQLKKSIERQSSGAIRIDAGSLYRAMAQLVDEGLIRESDERPRPDDDDTRRRYYELTKSGRDALEAEATRLARVVTLARRLRLVPPGGGTR